MSYTAAAAAAVLATVLLDLAVLRTRLLARPVFWVTYAIVVGFELAVDGVLAGRGVVRYAAGDVSGLRVVHAPVEDLMFGFALVTQTLCWWVWWGRRMPGRDAPPGAPAPGPVRPTGRG